MSLYTYTELIKIAFTISKVTKLILFFLSEFNTVIQVAYSVNEKDAYDREVNSLIAFAKTNHSKSNLMIVTYEEERIIEIDDLLIKVVPLKKFLLS